MEQLTKDATNARSVIQPFRNYKVDFTAPQITEKPTMFGTDKWLERQNKHISNQFTAIVRKIESLYMKEAARQVETAQRNVLTDYGELLQLRRDVKILAENYDDLKSTFETMLDQMANPSIHSKAEHLFPFPPMAEAVATQIPTFAGTEESRMRRKRRIGGGV